MSEHSLTMLSAPRGTRDAISRTALRLFVKQGIAATTVRDIAKAVGLAEGTLYRHWASKDELARQLFADNFVSLAEVLRRIQGEHAHLKAKLEAMIGHVCRLFEEDRELFAYLLLNQHAELPRVTSDMAHPVEVVIDALAAGMTRREIPRGDPELLAAMVMGLVLQVAQHRMYGRVKTRLDTLAPKLTRAAWRVLRMAR